MLDVCSKKLMGRFKIHWRRMQLKSKILSKNKPLNLAETILPLPHIWSSAVEKPMPRITLRQKLQKTIKKTKTGGELIKAAVCQILSTWKHLYNEWSYSDISGLMIIASGTKSSQLTLLMISVGNRSSPDLKNRNPRGIQQGHAKVTGLWIDPSDIFKQYRFSFTYQTE